MAKFKHEERRDVDFCRTDVVGAGGKGFGSIERVCVSPLYPLNLLEF